jgi:hypothetical protein
MYKLLGRAVALALFMVVAASCGDDGGPSGIDIRDYIASVSTVDGGASATYVPDYGLSLAVDGVFQEGDPPAEGDGPTADAAGAETVINGGSAQVVLTGDGEFVTIYIAIDGVSGYWRLTVPAATAVTLVLTFGAEIPEDAFDILYQLADDLGVVGPVFSASTDVVTVGAGEVQVSVSWDTPTDVDLHVIEPSEEEIYYGARTSATGGELDLDSNAACSLDNVNNENITWLDNAPSGSYTVRVDYWANCGIETATNYTVTVRRAGHSPLVFTGSFAPGDADAGGAGSGRTITTFTF